MKLKRAQEPFAVDWKSVVKKGSISCLTSRSSFLKMAHWKFCESKNMRKKSEGETLGDKLEMFSVFKLSLV